MCVGHSEFLTVMKGGELQAVKDELVWLLVMLQQLEKKCCSVLSYNILMAAYGASLSLTGKHGQSCKLVLMLAQTFKTRLRFFVMNISLTKIFFSKLYFFKNFSYF